MDRAKELLIVILIVIIGIIPRLYLLSYTNSGIESDEAIVGLMAKHINEGQKLPIFYYGQPYLGSLEALMVAGSFRLLGRSNATLKIIPFAFSLLLIGLTYALAKRYTDKFGAAVSALLCALGPSALILWSTKARGGFIELVVIGTLSLIIASDILLTSDRSFLKIRDRQFLVLGLLLGLGWWVNNQIIFYIAAIGLVFAVHMYRLFGFKRSIPYLLFSTLGFFIGGLPFWAANFFEEPMFKSFDVLAKAAPAGEIGSYFTGYFAEALPIIFGARRFWSTTDIFPGATIVVYLLYCGAIILTILRWMSHPGSLRSSRSRGARLKPPFGLLLTFLVCVSLIFSLSGFGWLSQAPRYLLPLYSVIFIFVGSAASTLRRAAAANPSPASKQLLSSGVYFLVGAVVVINLMSNFLGGVAVAGQPIVYKNERVGSDNTGLYAWLRINNYRHIYTNYWIGYRTAFETDEEITFSIFRTPATVRIPAYERAAAEVLGEYRVYVLVPSEAQAVGAALALQGYRFRTSSVGSYVVIDHLEPISDTSRRIKIPTRNISVDTRSEWASRIIDRDVGSRWGSGEPQKPGMEVSVRFNRSTLVSGIELDTGFWPQDAPSSIVVEAEGANGQRCVLFDSRVNEILQEPRRVWKLFFPPQYVRHLRFYQMGEKEVFDWSIAELSVFGPN